jgi:hypothetical protein
MYASSDSDVSSNAGRRSGGEDFPVGSPGSASAHAADTSTARTSHADRRRVTPMSNSQLIHKIGGYGTLKVSLFPEPALFTRA